MEPGGGSMRIYNDELLESILTDDTPEVRLDARNPPRAARLFEAFARRKGHTISSAPIEMAIEFVYVY